MKTTLFEGGATKINLLLRAAGLKGQQAVEAIRITTEEIIAYLKAEISKGNYNEVITLLAAKAIVFGKGALLDKITSRVASRLMLRLGLPGIIAAGVVAVLVPLVVMKLRKQAAEKKDAGVFLEAIDQQDQAELQRQVQHDLIGQDSPLAATPDEK
jgi:hypothetical protein